jgi:hypothetical protein
MRALKLLLAFVLVIISDADNWRDCGGENATVHWEKVEIPDPLRIKDLKLGGKWTIDEEIPVGSYSQIDIYRIVRVFFVPLFIKIACNNNIGSCPYDICRKASHDNFCSFQENTANTTCGCPMTPKTVEGYNYLVKIPELKLNALQTLLFNVIIQLSN